MMGAFTIVFARSWSYDEWLMLVLLEIRTRCEILRATLLRATTAGKCIGSSLMAASDSLDLTRRLFVTDRDMGVSFLINTGADLCVYPRKMIRSPRRDQRDV